MNVVVIKPTSVMVKRRPPGHWPLMGPGLTVSEPNELIVPAFMSKFWDLQPSLTASHVDRS